MIEKINYDAIKQALIERQISITECARRIGISPVTLYSILKDGEARSFKSIGKICAGLDLDYLTLKSKE